MMCIAVFWEVTGDAEVLKQVGTFMAVTLCLAIAMSMSALMLLLN